MTQHLQSEKHINGDRIHVSPLSIAQIAKNFDQGVRVIKFPGTMLYPESDAKNSPHSLDVVLTPVALSVVRTMNSYLGDLAGMVHLKTGIENQRSQGYATGLLVKSDVADEIKAAILEALNAKIASEDDKIKPSADGSITVGTERLSEIVRKLERAPRGHGLQIVR